MAIFLAKPKRSHSLQVGDETVIPGNINLLVIFTSAYRISRLGGGGCIVFCL